MKISIKDVLNQIRLFFIPYIILLCTCLIIKLTFSREEIFYAVNTRYSDWGDLFAPYITDIGNGWTTVILSAILVLFNYRKALLLAGAYALTSLFAQLIKFIVDAPRPKLYFHDKLVHIHFVKDVYILVSNSFPSGHTVTAFSTAVVITYLSKNKYWGILLLMIAVLVGYSRMYLSEHFFEDVTAGSAIGVFITVFWLKWIDSKAFIHSPRWNKGLMWR